MKTFRMIGMALVAMVLSFSVSSCSKNDDSFIPVDYTQDLVGTWTCLEADFAEALVISADGTVLSTGVEEGEFWENLKGTIKVENNKMELLFGEEDDFKGRFEMIPGEAFVIIEEGTGNRLTYRYCKQDLSEEIVGMWVGQTKDYTMIMHIEGNNKFVYTGSIDESSDYNYLEPALSQETSYKLMGDIFYYTMIIDDQEVSFCNRLSYDKDGSAYGDVLRLKGSKGIESSFLRVKQNLELLGQKYSYIKTFLTNASGSDKDFNAGGFIFNFAKLDGAFLDKMLKTLLFSVEFPDANTIQYSYTYNGKTVSASAPIEVDGNKMTVKMDQTRGYFRDMNLYAFQDNDNSQMHIYMSKYAFINYFGNIAVSLLAGTGQLDPNDQVEVDAVFDEISQMIQTINVSFIMSQSK